MELSHYFYLYPAYGIGLTGWYLFQRYYIEQRPCKDRDFELTKPWLDFIFAILAAVLTISIGQIYLAGYLIPNIAGIEFISQSINQILIFSPFILLLVLRRQPLTTVWIPEVGRYKSIFIGFTIAIISYITFLLLAGKNDILKEIMDVYNYKNLPSLVQVFLEDFAICLTLFRLMQWIGRQKAIIIMGFLFAAAHIPAMIANGVELENFSSLIFDTILGIVVLHFISKSKNFLWFWMLHYAMDMSQFIK